MCVCVCVCVVRVCQVISSVKESVDRTTSVLSNLHRVHSYLDILSNMSSNRASYGLKNALDQVGVVSGRGHIFYLDFLKMIVNF